MPGFNRRHFNRYLTNASLTSLLGTGMLANAAPRNSSNASLMRLIVPFAPGGGGDVLGRLFADKLSVELDRNIIVENKPGGSTTIGTDFVAKSKPDGNTILLTIPLLIQTYYLFKKLPYDPFTDLVPVVDLVKSPLWVAVSTQRTAATSIPEPDQRYQGQSQQAHVWVYRQRLNFPPPWQSPEQIGSPTWCMCHTRALLRSRWH